MRKCIWQFFGHVYLDTVSLGSFLCQHPNLHSVAPHWQAGDCCTAWVVSATRHRRTRCKDPSRPSPRNLHELSKPTSEVNEEEMIHSQQKCSRFVVSTMQANSNSPRTVSKTLTSTEPSRFLATHSYWAVSSFWALLILREPLDKVDKRSRPCRGRPWRDHSMVGVGSPSAWQFSTTVVPASTTVSADSTVMVGAPEDRKTRWFYYQVVKPTLLSSVMKQSS